MAASRNESKVVTPFMPSLLHCASVKLAVQLFEEFGVDTLEDAYTEIQDGNSTTSQENSTDIRRAKENLLCIPSHLRQGVMAAVHGSHQAALEWIRYHRIFKEEKCNFHWRSDGSFDAVKTAQSLVQNAKFHIEDRFELACAYFFNESATDLLAEMIKSRSFRANHDGSDGTLVFPPVFTKRRSAFFPQYSSEERQKNFDLLDAATFDDLRFCLYSLTKAEEEQLLLKKGAYRLLSLHLTWPLQTLFLQTAAKLWNFMDGDCFRALLSDIFLFNEKRKDFKYSELFERFWKLSPLHLKESARELPELKQRIDSYFEEKRRKRKFIIHDESQKFSKRK